jgi:hypothetical protein
MDRIGTSAGDKAGGEPQSVSGGDTEKHSEVSERLIYQRVICGIFLFLICISSVIGFAASKLSWYFAIPFGIFGGLIGMFLGIGIEWIRLSIEITDVKKELILERMMNDAKCRKQTRKAVDDARHEYVSLAIESARVLANRVANRIIARHASRLLEAEYREATIQDTDEIVEDELKSLKQSIRDEFDAEKNI